MAFILLQTTVTSYNVVSLCVSLRSKCVNPRCSQSQNFMFCYFAKRHKSCFSLAGIKTKSSLKMNPLPHNDGDCHFMQERQSGGWPYIVDSTSSCPVPRQNGDAVTKCTTLVPCYFGNWSTGICGVITLSPRSQ